MPVPTFIIWNPNAGRVADAEAVRSILEARPQTQLCEPDDEAQAKRCVQQAVRAGCELIVAAGGDGTVHSTVNVLWEMDAKATLAVLPLGTANDWCVSLGLPADLEQAVDLLDTGRRRMIDLIRVHSEAQPIVVANIATGGNSQRVAENLTADLKQRWGAWAYIRGALDVLADLDTFHVTLQMDDKPADDVKIWNIVVANGKTSGGRLMLAPRASLEDGLMDIICIREGTVGDVAEIAAKLAMSDYTESPQVEYYQAKKLTIQSTPSIRFSADGDPLDITPTTFEIIPQALRIIVGNDYPAKTT